MSKIRLGFVGVGGMGQAAHLFNYVVLPDCEVVAIAEVREKLGQKVATRYGIPRVYRNYREMLAAEDLDGIVCIQMYWNHAALVPEVLEKGVPVITEKPLAQTIQGGEKILEALRRTKNRLYVGYHKRSDPATVYARRQIDEWKRTGEVGALRYVRITMPPGDWIANGLSHVLGSDDPYPPHTPDPPPPGVDAETAKELDGFVNYYIHQVNLLRHLLTEDYKVSYADPTGAAMVVHSDSGVCATIEMAPYETSVDWQEQAMVCFAKGWIKIELPPPLAITRPGRVTVYKVPGENAPAHTLIPSLPNVHAMRQQAANFVAALRGEQTCLCEAEDALKDLRVARTYIEMRKAEAAK